MLWLYFNTNTHPFSPIFQNNAVQDKNTTQKALKTGLIFDTSFFFLKIQSLLNTDAKREGKGKRRLFFQISQL